MTDQVTIEKGSLVDQLVGEGKKFKTLDDLAAGKLAADEHIKLVQKENKVLTEVAGGADTANQVQNLLASLAETPKPQEGTPEVKQAEEGQPPKTPAQPAEVDMDTLKSLITDALSQERSLEAKQRNQLESSQALQDAFGDKAKEHLEARAQELGLTDEQILNLSAASPKAFKHLVGITSTNEGTSSNSDGSSAGDVNPGTIDFGKPQERNWAYYSELLRKDRRAYYSAKTQNAMLEDRSRLGEAFYS